MGYFREENVISLSDIKRKIQYLYHTNPYVHVNVSLRLPRTKRQTLTDIPVVIKGVYPNVFQIEDNSSGKPKLYMHQYNEIATKEIVIQELADVVLSNA